MLAKRQKSCDSENSSLQYFNHTKGQKTTCQSDYLLDVGYQIFKSLNFLSKKL